MVFITAISVLKKVVIVVLIKEIWSTRVDLFLFTPFFINFAL